MRSPSTHGSPIPDFLSLALLHAFSANYFHEFKCSAPLSGASAARSREKLRPVIVLFPEKSAAIAGDINCAKGSSTSQQWNNKRNERRNEANCLGE